MNVSQQIKFYREKNQFSQRDLANKLHVSEQIVYNWENNCIYPTIRDLLLISKIFNISIDELLKDDINIIERIIKRAELNRSILCFVFMIMLSFVSYSMKFEFGLIGIVVITILFTIDFIAYLNPEIFRRKKSTLRIYFEIIHFVEQRKYNDDNKRYLSNIIIYIFIIIFIFIFSMYFYR